MTKRKTKKERRTLPLGERPGDPFAGSKAGPSPEWQRLHELAQIVDAPQFPTREAAEVLGITEEQFKKTIARHPHLIAPPSPGKGRRALYSGGDILKIGAASRGAALGFPLRYAHLLADEITKRALNRQIGLAPKTGADYRLVTYPLADDDWGVVAIWGGMKKPPPLPSAYQVFEVDRIVDELIARLEALVDERPLPSFEPRRPAPEGVPPKKKT